MWKYRISENKKGNPNLLQNKDKNNKQDRKNT